MKRRSFLKTVSGGAIVAGAGTFGAPGLIRSARAADPVKIGCLFSSSGTLPAEPDTVAMFIGSQAELGLAESTLAHRLAAIRLMHLGQGLPSPHNALVVVVMRGLRRHRARSGGR